jgi:hypothetical protein
MKAALALLAFLALAGRANSSGVIRLETPAEVAADPASCE